MAFQTSLRDTPFYIAYGCKPPSIYSYGASETQVVVVDKTMEEKKELLGDVRYRLEPA
jgi:hypothetical protein